MSLLELFCDVDDFCLEFEPKWQTHLLNSGVKHRNRQAGLCLSEIMTIVLTHALRDRAFPPSKPGQFHHQSVRRPDCLLPSTQETILAPRHPMLDVA